MTATALPPPFTAAVTTATVLGCLAYLAAAARLRARGDAWPYGRDALFCAGGAVLVAGVAEPWGAAPPFTAHMLTHLCVGMAAPLLLVLGRPLTLVLRTAPVPVRRRLVSLARARWAAVWALPPVAALLDFGGLWLLYRTPLLSVAHHSPWLNTAVHVHILLAGALFSFGLLALDPVRHRPGPGLRAGVLLAAGAAHAVLAKSLYATGPPGTSFGTADLHLASQVMYYGGDAVELALAAVVAYQWYRAEGRALRRARRVQPRLRCEQPRPRRARRAQSRQRPGRAPVPTRW
ncbi:cytochrome c oxidase assembly protein [Streptomyces sp. NPDC059788]|uniref:cytochrome c oxidase assembly protein n=1 Tax=Streptomyces sp. NPDC059788 TaxID=3346948 RepID=UPI00365113A8